MLDLGDLLMQVCAIARGAGKKILQIYETDYGIERKYDNTPVTDADFAAHDCIVGKLALLEIKVPVLSEEAADIDFTIRNTWDTYWLIDPLDGTKEFISGTDEFTVNIALIHQHKSVLGVVYCPIKKLLYYAAENLKAWRKRGDEAACQIYVRSVPETVVSIVGSRSHKSEDMQKFVAQLGSVDLLSMGSSLKSCLVAEGSVDIYPRFGPTSEWDTAAAHCIVAEAGGQILSLDFKPLEYNTKDSLLNPEFIAIGDLRYNWQEILARL